MSPRALAAILACRLIRLILRLLKKGGTALPGKVSVKICPDLLRRLSKNVKAIVVTGTNGKTTSCRMLEQLFIDSAMSYFSNKSGSNLIQGITAEFAANCSLFGRPRKEFAIIECDEAASKKVCEYLNPVLILVTNVFRDQLDRYGEVSTTLNNIKIGVQNSPNAVVCLNADDSLVASIDDEIQNRVVFYGVDTPIYSGKTDEPSDATHCIRCKNLYEYDYVTFGHLGGFRCPVCGYSRPSPDVSVLELLSSDADTQTIRLNIFGEELTAALALPGGYNIYNAVGVSAAAAILGFSGEKIIAALAGFECGFGRMEKLFIGKSETRIILVKNPAGCNQVISYLKSCDGDRVFAVCLNDKFADGTDVSWIWDVGFERLLDMGGSLKEILVSGIRAEDMALRLKYAGIATDHIRVFKNYDDLLAAIGASSIPTCVMPTYTAMLALREKLSRELDIKYFWE